VFPGCQGGPHNNTIAGIAVALLQAAQPSFKAYAQQVIKNAQALAAALVKNGYAAVYSLVWLLADEERRYKLQTGGTDNHLILWDLRPLKLTGSKVEKICDLAGITINSASLHPLSSLHANISSTENAVSGDANAQAPGGIRLGTSALTSRSLVEKDMETVAEVRSSSSSSSSLPA